MRIEWIEKYMKDAEGMIYENQIEAGLNVLNGLLYEEPGYGSLHNHIGWAYMYYTADAAKAEQHLQWAIRFEAEFPAPYLHLGALYIRQWRYDEALSVLQKGLTKPGANRLALYENIGQVYELKKEYTKAVRAYKEGLASTAGGDTYQMTEGIKRCRKKRWVMMFTF
ncbi:MAG: hypothetical protein HOP08_15615 [Cyclobacteriaceae bacterium]|nr:hypothetical protein [Cyclobacteriaceae bacterium]